MSETLDHFDLFGKNMPASDEVATAFLQDMNKPPRVELGAMTGRSSEKEQPMLELTDYHHEPPAEDTIATGDQYAAGETTVNGGPAGSHGYKQKWEMLRSENGDSLIVESGFGGGVGDQIPDRDLKRYSFRISGIEVVGDAKGIQMVTLKDGTEIDLGRKGQDRISIGMPDGKYLRVREKDGVTSIDYPSGDKVQLDKDGIKLISRTIDGKKVEVDRCKLPKPTQSWEMRP